jgi:hypothetical protein
VTKASVDGTGRAPVLSNIETGPTLGFANMIPMPEVIRIAHVNGYPCQREKSGADWVEMVGSD